MIGGVAVVLPYGKLFGLYNAKSLYIGSTVLFMAGSALCGGAPNMNAIIVGRVIAGVGGNGMYLGVMTLISVNTNDKERPMYLGLMSASASSRVGSLKALIGDSSGLIFGIGTVVGPVIGGKCILLPTEFRTEFSETRSIRGIQCYVALGILYQPGRWWYFCPSLHFPFANIRSSTPSNIRRADP